MGNKKEKESVTKTKKEKTETTSLSVINTQELNDLIEEDLKEDKTASKHVFTHIALLVLGVVSLVYYGIILFNKDASIIDILSNGFLTIFTLLFSVIGITYKRNHKTMILVSAFLLLGFFGLGFYMQNNTFSISKTIPNFSNKSVVEVMKWADAHDVMIEQVYEYSDMVEEYKIISQSLEAGSSSKGVQELTISVSEGPNPSKEIMVPNMLSWDSERVIKFVEDNYLTNVLIEYTTSDKAVDTVIEQSASGSLKRDDELKLVLSLGEEEPSEEFTIIDFKNKSKFQVEFYMKQHLLKYTFTEEFSSSIKRGNAVSQSIQAGEKVKPKETEINVVISKGNEIKVPDLTKYSMEEVSEWAIKNRVKISFSNQYDDKISENGIISANYKEGDVIEQGTIVKIVISRGNLKMPKFDSVNDFFDWATEYNIPYDEVHEFNDSIPAGSVISYSYKEGDVIKNKDTIIVKISDGVKKTVPNVVGLTKSEAISRLDKAGLKYSFVYRNNSAQKDKVLAQSIRSGSEVSSGTTITVTLSNGKTEVTPTPPSTPTPQPEPQQPTCESVKVYIDGSHIKSDPTATCSTIKSAYPSLKFTCSYVCGPTNGLLLNGDSEIDDHTFTTCDTINLKIADSSKC